MSRRPSSVGALLLLCSLAGCASLPPRTSAPNFISEGDPGAWYCSTTYPVQCELPPAQAYGQPRFYRVQLGGGGISGYPLNITSPSNDECLLLQGPPWVIVNGSCSGSASTAWANITGGTNTTAAMLVGAGASLGYTSTGVVNANEINGLTFPTLVSSDCLTNNGTVLSWGTCGGGLSAISAQQVLGNTGATFSGAISGTTLTVSSVNGTIADGQTVTGTGVTGGTIIESGSGTTWTVNNSQTVSTEPMIAGASATPTAISSPILSSLAIETLATGSGNTTIPQLSGTTPSGNFTIAAGNFTIGSTGTAPYLCSNGTGATARWYESQAEVGYFGDFYYCSGQAGPYLSLTMINNTANYGGAFEASNSNGDGPLLGVETYASTGCTNSEWFGTLQPAYTTHNCSVLQSDVPGLSDYPLVMCYQDSTANTCTIESFWGANATWGAIGDTTPVKWYNVTSTGTNQATVTIGDTNSGSETSIQGGAGVEVGSPTGGYKGAGTLNMAGCYINGVTCGTASITLQTNGTNNSSQTALNIENGQGVQCSNPSSGNVQCETTQPERTVTGTSDTISCTTDSGGVILYNSSSAVAVTVPQATGSCAAGFAFTVENSGSANATLTPTTSTIQGLSSLVIPTNQGCSLWSDGTNYQVAACTALSSLVDALSSGTSITPSCAYGANTVTITGNATINAPTGCTPHTGQKLFLDIQSASSYTYTASSYITGSTTGSWPASSTGSSKDDHFELIYDGYLGSPGWTLAAYNLGL